MRWARNAARKGDMRSVYKILIGKPEGKRPLGRHSVYGKKILEGILGKQGGKVWTDKSGSG
jgi:hypothetical protein